jgi:tetratricopeptide (TPR) repeat protein
LEDGETIMTKLSRVLMLMGACVFGAGCALRGAASHECTAPDGRLAELRRRAEIGEITRVQLADSLQRLAAICPRTATVLLAAAEASYAGADFVAAQQYLDKLTSVAQSVPAATVLRAQIALRDGNHRYARRIVDNEIKRVPNHSELREVQAAILFLQGEYPEATRAIEAAVRLGAPYWRAAYNLGLIAEAQGQRDAAERFYRESVLLLPSWPRAQQRLEGLLAN